MIISDSHKFIFFHVPKTAGSSIACKLAPYSNNSKLLFPDYGLHIERIIKERYSDNNRSNVEKIVKKIPRGAVIDFYESNRQNISWMHLPHFMFSPHQILRGGPIAQYLEDNVEKFHDYCKFAIVRNSWDYAFSIFKNKIVVDQVAKEWDESMDWDEMVNQRINKASFLNFINNIEDDYPNIFNHFFYNHFYQLNLNQQVYFCDRNMRSYANHILLFDRLEEGLGQMSEKIGVDLRTIPRCNISGEKKNSNYYTDFYDDAARKFVGDIFQQDIERFNFKFGQ